MTSPATSATAADHEPANVLISPQRRNISWGGSTYPWSSAVIVGVAGTATMAVAFLLLSQMDAATPVWRQSLYLFVLGAGIGLCMQVLILVVQNTSSFADLGVATSGVTFFRTIGSSFGAAIFGSLFANFLAGRIGPALAASGAPARAAESPQALHELSPAAAAPIVDAYADSLGRVFLCAVPIAAVGFVVSLFLREVSSASWRRSRRPTSARASECRAPSRPRKSSQSPLDGCSGTRPTSGCVCSPGNPDVTSMSARCGRCCRSTGRIRCSARRR